MHQFGLWGHSFGGAAALEACRLDARCAAAADLDGSPFGPVAQAGLDKPVFYMASDPARHNNPALVKADAALAAIVAKAPHGYQATLRGARHFNFTDYAAEFNPAGHLLGVLGSINGVRGLALSGDYLGAFFGQVLKGEPGDLLKGPASRYPEVEIQGH